MQTIGKSKILKLVGRHKEACTRTNTCLLLKTRSSFRTMSIILVQLMLNSSKIGILLMILQLVQDNTTYFPANTIS